MTREKIIQGLYRGDSRAIKEAIKTLEKEPCEDSVSRYGAVRIVQHNNPPKAIEKLRKLPSVTPARKKGHWIDHSDEGFVECSNCGSATNCDGNIADLHFCFSCGADMESKE